MTGAPAAPAATGAFQPLNSVWNHKLLVVIVALVVAVGGTFVAYIKGTAVYRATAVIYVAPRFASLLEESKELEFQSNAQYQQFVQQQQRTINRYDIVLEALRRLGERRFVLWQKPDESDREAAERLQGALNIREVRDTYLITVSLDSTLREGLDAIVNNVVEVYLERVKLEEIYASGDRVEILREHQASRRARIAALIERRGELAQMLGVSTFADGTLNPYDGLLVDSNAAVIAAERARIRAEAALSTYDERSGGDPAARALAAAASDEASTDPGLNSLKANLYQRRSQLLEQTTGLGPEHPVRRKAERELADLQAEVQRASQALIDEKSALLLEQRLAEVRETSRVEGVLRQLLAAQREQAATFAGAYNEALDVTEAITRERKALDAVDDRIEFLELESTAPGFVRVSTWALEPLLPVAGGRTKLAVLFAIVGGVLGLLSAIAVDLLDRRVRTSRQVQSILGFPPLASFLEPSEDPAHRALLADQLRRLGQALGREQHENGVRRLLVTSVRHGCGATTVVLDLARELDRQGLRVLVVEVNLLIPDPRYQATPPRPGLTDLLADDLDPLSAVISFDDTLPDRIGTGRADAGHLAECGRLAAVLERLDAAYDLVLIDAAPIRLSADTEFLVGLCDATWLVVRALLAEVGEVKGAAGRLERAGPPAIGLIMTGLRIFRGGGYYGELLKEYRKVEQARSQRQSAEAPKAAA